MRQQRRLERQQRWRRGWYRFFRAITILIFLVAALSVGVIGGLFAAVRDGLPTGEGLANIRPASPTRILASDGSLLARFYSENREPIAYDKMGDYIIDATIAIEDVRFEQHNGVDPRGIVRAAYKNLQAGDSKEGASTITQQLARSLYLSREKSISRKLKEVILALELEQRYSKEEILETYLNQVFYGANQHGVQSYGVQMAAQNYFEKDIAELTLAQAALLAGLPKNPRDYNPYRYPDRALGRRNQVLWNMRHYGFIDDTQYQTAHDTPLKLAKEKHLQLMADMHAPYFVRYVLVTELEKIFGQDAQPLTYQYGIDVYTSLDPRMQKKAEEIVGERVRANRSRNIDDGALIAIDPKTGLIKAMVGGTNYRHDQFNIVTQGRRQPGSSFKPFVYTTALLHGYKPVTPVRDRAVKYPAGGGKTWSPRNSDGRYMGSMQLQRALWLSRNAAAVNIAADVTIEKVIDIAHRMGVKTELDPVLPTAIGATAITPLEICSAYGTLANSGIHYEPMSIVRVTTPEGDVLYEHAPKAERVIPRDIADTMKTMMRGTIERGTATRAMGHLPFKASGKTGTTNSYRDAWFIGFTDDLVAAVWVGNRSNAPMNRTFGSTVPVPIWRDFLLVAHPIMADEHRKEQSKLAALNNVPDITNIDRSLSPYIRKGNFRTTRETTSTRTPTPEVDPAASDRNTVMICRQTQLRATANCPDTVAMRFTGGRVPPSRQCNVHTRPAANTPQPDQDRPAGQGVMMSICGETQKIATENCPHVVRKRMAPEDAPTETCPLHRRR